MDPFDDPALGARIVTAAQAAGEVALSFFRPGARTSALVRTKEGGSPVTEADHQADDLLRAQLGALLPDAGWLSEETPDTDARLACRYVFVVDPIDGTRAFLSGDPRWAICVALAIDGLPAFGVVHLPALEQTYVAARGHGATRNGQPLHVSTREHLSGGRIAAPQGMLNALGRGGLMFETEPRIPSLAYRIVRVADGSLDAAMASSNSCDWDIAAADIILTEAGGLLTALDGAAPLYNGAAPQHPPLLAAPAGLHGALMRAAERAIAHPST